MLPDFFCVSFILSCPYRAVFVLKEDKKKRCCKMQHPFIIIFESNGFSRYYQMSWFAPSA